MRSKILIGIGVVVVLFFAFGVCLFSGTFSPRAPAAWSQVHAGMSRPQVLALVGTPRWSGWPENITETWQLNGLVSHRRLFIVYDGERVKYVTDGTWVRGYGWSHPRKESL